MVQFVSVRLPFTIVGLVSSSSIYTLYLSPATLTYPPLTPVAAGAVQEKAAVPSRLSLITKSVGSAGVSLPTKTRASAAGP